MLGVAYRPLQGSEFGSWGSAMIAGKAAWGFDDRASVADEHAVPAGAPIYPNLDNHATYKTLVTQYIQWQMTLQDAFVQQDRAA